MKKILFITEDFIKGGVAQVSQNLTIALNQVDGYEMDIGLLNAKNDYPEFNPIFVLNQKSAKGKFGKIFRLLTDAVKLMNRVRGYDLIIGNGDLFQIVIPLWLVAKIRSIKCIFWVHACLTDVKYYPNRIIKKLHCMGLQKYKIVCVSHQSKNSFIKYTAGKIDDDNIEVIYNLLNQANSRLNVSNYIRNCQKLKLISLGRLVKEKNFALIIKALAILNNSNINLTICGAGPEMGNLLKLVQENSLQDMVFFAGQVDNPHEWINNSDAVVISSDTEALPTVAIEGIYLGKLVIATDTGAKEVLTADCGVIVPCGNEFALATKLEELYNNPALIQKLTATCHVALEKFEPQKVIPKWIELINREFEET